VPAPDTGISFELPGQTRQRRRGQTPWLSASIARMAEFDDPRLAARLIVELLPVQALFVRWPVTYALGIEELGDYRVTIAEGKITIGQSSDPGTPGSLDFSIQGPAESLAPLVAGATRRRLAGATVSGKRRIQRRLLRSMRHPVGLDDLAWAGLPIDPGLVLAALTGAVDPRWTDGHRFTVAYVLTDEPQSSLHLEIRDGEPIRVVRDAPEGETPPAATVALSRATFLPMLANGQIPRDQQPEVTGNTNALELLSRWFARAQGLDAGA
jgi:hypothetical protein